MTAPKMRRRPRAAAEVLPEASTPPVDVDATDRLDPRVYLFAPEGISDLALVHWAKLNAPAHVLPDEVAEARAQSRVESAAWGELSVEDKRTAIRAARRDDVRVVGRPPRAYWTSA